MFVVNTKITPHFILYLWLASAPIDNPIQRKQRDGGHMVGVVALAVAWVDVPLTADERNNSNACNNRYHPCLEIQKNLLIIM